MPCPGIEVTSRCVCCFCLNADLGRCNALTNQEAKLVLKQFSSANTSANKLWAPPALAQKAMDYLDKVEQKTDVQHRETVGRFRE